MQKGSSTAEIFGSCSIINIRLDRGLDVFGLQHVFGKGPKPDRYDNGLYATDGVEWYFNGGLLTFWLVFERNWVFS